MRWNRSSPKRLFRRVGRSISQRYKKCLYIGRGADYNVSLEAALKLKEISYIQAEGFAAGR